MKAILEGTECQLSIQVKDALLSLIQATFTILNSVLNSTIEDAYILGILNADRNTVYEVYN